MEGGEAEAEEADKDDEEKKMKRGGAWKEGKKWGEQRACALV